MYTISSEFNCLAGIYGKGSTKLIEYIESHRVIILFLGVCTSIVHLPGRVQQFQKKGNCVILYWFSVWWEREAKCGSFPSSLLPRLCVQARSKPPWIMLVEGSKPWQAFFVKAKLSLFSHYAANPNWNLI